MAPPVGVMLHRLPPKFPDIRLTTYTVGDLPAFNFLHRLQDGYPEPILTSQERIITHRHTEGVICVFPDIFCSCCLL